MQAHAQGVSLSLWVDNAPTPINEWLDLHPATRLLDQWPHEETTASAVRLSHEDIAALQDYDATRLGLPRHVPADICVTVSGRPESVNLHADFAVMPYTHHRPWAQARTEHGMLYYDGAAYRLRPAQYQAVHAAAVLADLDATLSAKLEAYNSLAKLRRTAGQGGVQVQGYMPALSVETVRDFTLHSDPRGVCLVPGVRQAEPLVPQGTSLATRWSDAWFGAEHIPELALLAGHRYLMLDEAWHTALQHARAALQGQHDPIAARGIIAQFFTVEQLRRVH